MSNNKRYSNNSFSETLDKVNDILEKATLSAETIGILYEKGDYAECYSECFSLAKLGEKIALHTRMLPVYTGRPKTYGLIQNLVYGEYPIDIGYTKEWWFGIRLPMLMPKKETGQVNYLRDLLYSLLGRFVNDHGVIRYDKEMVMIFRHVYSEGRPERQKRDHDNFEVNMVSDVIALYMLVDDSPAYCSHYHCTALGESECTEIYLVPKEEFPVWLQREAELPKGRSFLDEIL